MATGFGWCQTIGSRCPDWPSNISVLDLLLTLGAVWYYGVGVASLELRVYMSARRRVEAALIYPFLLYRNKKTHLPFLFSK